MNQLHSTLQTPPPHIAAVVDKPLNPDSLEQIQEFADIAELRADLLPCHDPNYLREQIQALGSLPILLTIRTRQEGGTWRRTELERLNLFTSLIEEVDGIDIEHSASIRDSIANLARDNDVVRIISRHDMKGIRSPADLHAQYASTPACDYMKFACTVQSRADYRVLEQFTAEHAHLGNLIVVGMGAWGSLSRVSLPALGSRLVYASCGGDALVPGQMDLETTHKYLSNLYPTTN